MGAVARRRCSTIAGAVVGGAHSLTMHAAHSCRAVLIETMPDSPGWSTACSPTAPQPAAPQPAVPGTTVPVAAYAGLVADAVYLMTPAQRRAARQGWARVDAATRRRAVQRAEQGLPAEQEPVAAAAAEYGRYLLHVGVSNRLPRWLQPAVGAVVAVVGVLLLVGVLAVPGRVGGGVIFTVGGLLVVALGLLGWAQRKAAHLLVAANAAAADGEAGR